MGTYVDSSGLGKAGKRGGEGRVAAQRLLAGRSNTCVLEAALLSGGVVRVRTGGHHRGFPLAREQMASGPRI